MRRGPLPLLSLAVPDATALPAHACGPSSTIAGGVRPREGAPDPQSVARLDADGAVRFQRIAALNP